MNSKNYLEFCVKNYDFKLFELHEHATEVENTIVNNFAATGSNIVLDPAQPVQNPENSDNELVGSITSTYMSVDVEMAGA